MAGAGNKTNNHRKTTPRPMPETEIMNIDDAAAFLGVSVKTFSKVLREGDVPGRKVGREWKFSRQALIDWIGHSRSAAFLEAAETEESEDAPAPTRSPRPRRGQPRPKRRADDFSVDEM